ncbi:MAG: secretion protein HlyD [Rhodomicrobium sp.]
MKFRRFIILALIAGGAAGGYWWYFLRAKANGPLVLQGNVEVRQVNLGFKVAGRVEKLNVDEGDVVLAGQTLASLEKVYFDDALAQARAQRDQMAANYEKLKAGNRPEEIAEARALVAEREATLINARIILKRAQTLLNTPAGSQKAVDDGQAAERQADAQLNSSREALRLQEAGFRKEDIELGKAQLGERQAAVLTAERNLADADLIAPSGGTVLSRVREVGAIVATGEAVYVLSLTTPLWVRTYVSEPDLGRVRPGVEVQVKTDTPGAKTYSGRIGFISTAAEFTPKTVETTELRTSLVYRLRIVVDDSTGFLRQGMPVTVTVAAPQHEGTPVASSNVP